MYCISCHQYALFVPKLGTFLVDLMKENLMKEHNYDFLHIARFTFSCFHFSVISNFKLIKIFHVLLQKCHFLAIIWPKKLKVLTIIFYNFVEVLKKSKFIQSWLSCHWLLKWLQNFSTNWTKSCHERAKRRQFGLKPGIFWVSLIEQSIEGCQSIIWPKFSSN